MKSSTMEKEMKILLGKEEGELSWLFTAACSAVSGSLAALLFYQRITHPSSSYRENMKTPAVQSMGQKIMSLAFPSGIVSPEWTHTLSSSFFYFLLHFLSLCLQHYSTSILLHFYSVFETSENYSRLPPG